MTREINAVELEGRLTKIESSQEHSQKLLDEIHGAFFGKGCLSDQVSENSTNIKELNHIAKFILSIVCAMIIGIAVFLMTVDFEPRAPRAPKAYTEGSK